MESWVKRARWFERKAFVAALVVVSLGGCRTPGGSPPDREFTIAMIPDTQNYVDYTHQRDAGFALAVEKTGGRIGS